MAQASGANGSVQTVDGPTRNTTRLTVNVPVDTLKALREMANARSTTVTEMLRRAVAVLKLLDDEQREGGVVHLVRKQDNTVREVHLI